MDKRYDKEYWERLDRNWRRWKESQWKKNRLGKTVLETIKEEEKIKQEELEVREWTKEDNNEMGNIVDLYYEL